MAASIVKPEPSNFDLAILFSRPQWLNWARNQAHLGCPGFDRLGQRRSLDGFGASRHNGNVTNLLHLGLLLSLALIGVHAEGVEVRA